jgi:peptide/nickel transport system permease protein
MILRHIIPNTLFPVIARAPDRTWARPHHPGRAQLHRLRPGPYVPEWGSLVAAGQSYIFQAPWLVIFPGRRDLPHVALA